MKSLKMIPTLALVTIAATASAGDVNCDDPELSANAQMHCKHLVAQADLRGDVTDLNVAVGILDERLSGVEKAVSPPIESQQAGQQHTLGQPQGASGATYYEMGLPAQNAAARSCSMLEGIDSKIRIEDLREGAKRHTRTQDLPPMKVIVRKDGTVLSVRTSSGYEPFYADLDGDGKADPTPYNGVAASGNLCVAAQPGERIEVLYLVRDGQVVVNGVPHDKWRPIVQVKHLQSGYRGEYRTFARAGFGQRY